MVSRRLPCLRGWGNLHGPYQALLDCLCPLGEDRGRFFFCGHGLASLADHRMQRVGSSPACQLQALYDSPLYPRFLGRPRLLTRFSPRRAEKGVSISPCPIPAPCQANTWSRAHAQ